jgi:hypothetical protein
MARGVDNTKPLSDGATYFIVDELGRRQLRQVESHQGQTEGGLSAVTGPSGVLGSVRAAGAFPLTLNVRHARTVRDEVAWHTLHKNDARFVIEVQYRGGIRKVYSDCGVSTISDGAGADGNVTFEVALLATKMDVVESARA